MGIEKGRFKRKCNILEYKQQVHDCLKVSEPGPSNARPSKYHSFKSAESNLALNSTIGFQLCGSCGSPVSTLINVMPRLDRKNQTGVAIGGTSRLFTRAIPLGTSPWQTAFMIESLLESVDDCGSIITHVHGCSASLSIAEMTVKVLVKHLERRARCSIPKNGISTCSSAPYWSRQFEGHTWGARLLPCKSDPLAIYGSFEDVGIGKVSLTESLGTLVLWLGQSGCSGQGATALAFVRFPLRGSRNGLAKYVPVSVS